MYKTGRAPLPQRVFRSEPFCSVLQKKMSDSVGASEWSDPSNQAAYLLKQEHAQTRWFAGHCRRFISRKPQPGRPPVEGTSSGPVLMARLREKVE